jgi:hypothetical protein
LLVLVCGTRVRSAQQQPPGNALSGFEGSIIFQKIRHAGRPERVRFRRWSGAFRIGKLFLQNWR